MRTALDKTLRGKLEKTVEKARDMVEVAVTEALTRLGVAEGSAPSYLSEDERKLRNRLRAHSRQLGDVLNKDSGKQEVELLINEMAYEHWHRMLFARFLEQNNLLMYDQNTNVTLDECFELAEDGDPLGDGTEVKDGWELAGLLAQKMLPQIFRADSPVFEVKLSINHVNALEELIAALHTDTFQSSDALGWCYQFWQNKKKKQVNESGVKIGAKELSPVTQLFTEPYMVSFLLDNALGAWWAKRRLTQDDLKNASSEQELRELAAIPGIPLEYLRFIKDEESGVWKSAAGDFEKWPEHLSELKTLDPCCGSGHFLVAVFLMLVPMRMQTENLNAQQAIDKVLSQNLHGLELDQRCVEQAAFAVALEAWRYPQAGGYRSLPELHLACSGLSITAAREEWKALSKKTGKQNLTIPLDWMYQTFQDAPVLGSLINPSRSKAAQIAPWNELQTLLGEALSHEQNKPLDAADADVSLHTNRLEAGIVAQGLAKAAELLNGQYGWVITNVPYLARGKQHDTLRDYCDTYYPEGKNDLATVFLDRCLEFCNQGGTASVVLPQNWLFLTSYRKFREKLLNNETWHLIARMGEGAFESSAAAGAFVALISLSRGNATGQAADLLHSGEQGNWLRGIDVSEQRTAAEKAAGLLVEEVKSVEQGKQLENPDARISFEKNTEVELLSNFSNSFQGLCTSDNAQFLRTFWEQPICSKWKFLQNALTNQENYSGQMNVLFWEDGKGKYFKHAMALKKERRLGGWKSGGQAWGKKGISINVTRNLISGLYSTEFFDNTIGVVVPSEEKYLTPIYCYVNSPEYIEEVRAIDQSLSVTEHTLLKVPFDLEHWTTVAEEQYPNGLPQPYTNDPTQWIFHGHPCGSVIWDEQSKRTAEGKLRVDDTVLQVAVARLLGYQWPAELDADMELAAKQREWVERTQALNQFVDDDGIVCLAAVRGEKAAVDRLETILYAAYGDKWSATVLNNLLKSVKSRDLNLWLRDKFFEQHCKLFQHRPFIWHIWDGLPDGFSALVNYHQLDYKGLERLIYTYLDDWISTQIQQEKDGDEGAELRLTAARNLRGQLEAILVGEKGLDIFVRWKALAEQPIGWNPDLNDGVRLNIRPFMQAKDVGKKGAGILRSKPTIHWKKDRGKDVESAPWYDLGLEYGGKQGDRINDHYLTLAEKKAARENNND